MALSHFRKVVQVGVGALLQEKQLHSGPPFNPPRGGLKTKRYCTIYRLCKATAYAKKNKAIKIQCSDPIFKHA